MFVRVCSMLSSDSRASSLLRGSASRKQATDRDMHMTLWKNYVVMGCCIAPPSHHNMLVAGAVQLQSTMSTDCRCVTPDITSAAASANAASATASAVSV